ncbi:MAG: hypothetical protein MH252_12635 [Thermosynechococcaceae cyanobacterium MS004]|nr:hypothetical protein [Thermosynechococcaceae cyanobacterium MS004]
MKRLLTLALAVLPFATVPVITEPAAAQIRIQFGDSSRDRRPVYVRPAPRRVNRVLRRNARRVWVPGRWEYNQRGRRGRVWVPGYYR